MVLSQTITFYSHNDINCYPHSTHVPTPRYRWVARTGGGPNGTDHHPRPIYAEIIRTLIQRQTKWQTC